ncbi:MAG: 4Fe-4S ferredoxin, partial [Deltaproteobacteria bacterium]|nr:4Fe-4S ferredoxin [Deltaproteobacteria bacterium]
MKSDVYFIDLRATFKENFVAKLGRLIETAGLSTAVKKRDLVAVKLHFGEMG